METIKVFDEEYPLHRCAALVIGTGCAGYNAADTLYDLGYRDVLIVTEGIYMGTSRNTGSDKQTYYKLAIQSGETDSVEQMARTLADGGSVNGDTAYVEAVNSLRCFMKLVNLGVPFPTNDFGEFVGYQTDHTTTKRATSAGPLTSKYMTECLEAQVQKKQIPILDNITIVQILHNEDGVYGAVGLERKEALAGSGSYHIFLADNIIAATGGPAAVYQNRVYPPSQSGMTGMLIDTGAACVNLQEWQYGIASSSFRWNLSGTYQQVLPRYVSVDKDGVAREFLPEYFATPEEALDMVFLKGYQWPFDYAKLDGSSVIDMLVYHEEMELGRKVYLDYRTDPKGLENGFAALSQETYGYLEKSNALMPTPIQRLAKMNPAAIKLYADHGIDLYTQLLPITVAAQHCNGGVAVDIHWQTTIPGLYVVGEAAGTFGVYRPGGSALNSCQVGSLRAAEHIAFSGRKHKNAEFEMPEASLIKSVQLDSEETEKQRLRIGEIKKTMAQQMSVCAAHIRSRTHLEALRETAGAYLDEVKAMSKNLCAEHMLSWFRLRDMLTTQIAMIDSMLLAQSQIGSRGGSIFYRMPLPGKNNRRIVDLLKEFGRGAAFKERDRLLYYKKDQGCWFEKARPMPVTQNWFETVWTEYRSKRENTQTAPDSDCHI